MICVNCGHENEEGSKFCSNCGTPLSAPEEKQEEKQEQPEKQENEEDITEGKSPLGDNTAPDTEPEMGKSAASTIESGLNSAVSQAATALDNHLLKLILSVSGIVIAVLYVIFALGNVPSIFNSVSAILRGRLFYGLFYIIAAVLQILSRVLMAAGLLLFAFCRDDERDNTESLLLTVASCGILRVILQVAAQICYTFAVVSYYGRFRFAFLPVGKAFLYALLAVAIEVGLTFLAGYRPFIGKSVDDLMNEIKNLPNVLTAEIENFSKKYKEKSGQKQTTAAGGNFSGNNQAPGVELMNEKRSYLMYLIVGIITCGIYQLYVIYTFSRDVNIICKEDGETTPGLIKLILLSLITCGIYSFVWYYKMLTRIEKQEKNWGLQTRTIAGMDLGACWVIAKLVGILVTVCGVGVLVSCYADYLLFKNLNELSAEYNKRVQNAGTI